MVSGLALTAAAGRALLGERLRPQNQSAQRSIVPCRSQERSSWTTVQYPTMALI